MIYCKRYGYDVNEQAECMCPSCIFWKSYKTPSGLIYHKCDYENWQPGLKKGKK